MKIELIKKLKIKQNKIFKNILNMDIIIVNIANGDIILKKIKLIMKFKIKQNKILKNILNMDKFK